MAIIPPPKDLQMAIMELDILYEDLTQKNKNRKPEPTTDDIVTPVLTSSNERISTKETDEEDYDIPRPTGSVFNSPMPSNHMSGTVSTQKLDTQHPIAQDKFIANDENDDEDYSVPPDSKTRSPALSVVSKRSSSGFGTLPLGTGRAELLSGGKGISDSDYDEVATDGDEEPDVVYSQPFKKGLNRNRHEGPAVNTKKNDVVPVMNMNGKAQEPEYDEVCSIASYSRKQKSEKLTENISNSGGAKHNVTTSRAPSQNAHAGVGDDVTRISIEHGDDIKEVMDDTSLISYSRDAAAEVRRTPDQESNDLSEEASEMTAHSSNEHKRGRNDCLCECPTAVPLMSCAVIICMTLLIFAAVAYVYIGLQMEKSSGITTTAVNETSATGDGN